MSVAFTATVVLSGMIAFGYNSGNNEMMAVLVNEDSLHGHAPVHHPVFEFPCGDTASLSEVEVKSGVIKVKRTTDVPCSAFAPSLNGFDRAIAIDGYDVEIMTNEVQTSQSLKLLDCTKTPAICRCGVTSRPFCDFSAALFMNTIQARSKDMRKEIFQGRKILDKKTKSLVHARVMMRGGIVGTTLDRATDWSFYKPVDVNGNETPESGNWLPIDYSSPLKTRWDIDVDQPSSGSPSITFVFFRHADESLSFALKFGSNASFQIANEPTTKELCEFLRHGLYEHFSRFYELGGDVSGRIAIPELEEDPRPECANYLKKLEEGTSAGKYPVVCLSPVMESSYNLPTP